MKILVDEDLASRALLRMLAELDGVELLPPQREASDDDVWNRAQVEGAAILTGNARDFAELARRHVDHAGLMLVSRLNRPGDLRAADIASAVAEICKAYPRGIAGMTLVVNAFAGERQT